MKGPIKDKSKSCFWKNLLWFIIGLIVGYNFGLGG